MFGAHPGPCTFPPLLRLATTTRKARCAQRHSADYKSSPAKTPRDKWHELIGDPTYVNAILDRIVHNAHLQS
jgi:hypothetical protein